MLLFITTMMMKEIEQPTSLFQRKTVKLTTREKKSVRIKTTKKNHKYKKVSIISAVSNKTLQNKKRKAEEKKSERNKDKIKLNEILLTVYNQKWISFVQPTITLQVEQEKRRYRRKKILVAIYLNLFIATLTVDSMKSFRF